MTSGETLWSKDEIRRISGALLVAGRAPDREVKLTKRETDVLSLVALGLTNKEIAKNLGIGYETVKEHVQHLLQKLEVTDRVQAAVWAVRRQLI